MPGSASFGGSKVLSLAAGLIAVLLAVWLLSSLQSPSLQTVWEATKNHWLFVLLALAILYFLTFLIPEERKGVVNPSRWFVVLLGLLLFVGFPVLSWMVSNSSSDCVAVHPCVLSSNDDGSSNIVEVKKGQVACFEPWMWSHLDELGLMISYRAARIAERPFPCSLKEVYGGSCTATYDHFSFKPKQKTRLPNYWFMTSGSKQC